MINFCEYDQMEIWKVFQMKILVLKGIGKGMRTQNLFHVDNYLNCNALDILDRSGIGYLRSWLFKLQLYLDIHIYMSYLRTTVAI